MYDNGDKEAAEYWKNKFSNLTFVLAAILSSLPEKRASYKDIDLVRFCSWKDTKFTIVRDELNRQTVITLEN